MATLQITFCKIWIRFLVGRREKNAILLVILSITFKINRFMFAKNVQYIYYHDVISCSCSAVIHSTRNVLTGSRFLYRNWLADGTQVKVWTVWKKNICFRLVLTCRVNKKNFLTKWATADLTENIGPHKYTPILPRRRR